MGFYEAVIVTERLEKSWCACLDLQNVTDNLRVLGFDYKCHYKHTQIEYMTDVDMNKSQYIFEDFFYMFTNLITRTLIEVCNSLLNSCK